jgi:hypothetical protein
MPWSTEDTRPAEPVLGDPASLSALAAVLRRTAADLDAALERLPLGSAQERRHHRRLRALHDRGTSVTASMERTGHRLAEHAADLADALGLAQRIVQRADSLGLRVDGPLVTRPGGVRGVADAQTERSRDDAVQRLQRVLDAVLLDLDARRGVLRADLDSEHDARASR